MNNSGETQSVLQDINELRMKSLETLGLAISLIDNGDRINDSLSRFEDGFAKGWRMAVGTCFLDALDIKKTYRFESGKKTCILTQGGAFCFSQGDIIYDNPKAYEQWETALNSTNIAYQVLAGAPSTPKSEVVLFRKNTSFNGPLKGESETGANVKRRAFILKAIPDDWVTFEEINNYVSNNTGSGVTLETLQKLCNLNALDKKIELTRPRFPGYIRFQIMVPTFDRSRFSIQTEVTMSQDDFIALLITGLDQPTQSTATPDPAP